MIRTRDHFSQSDFTKQDASDDDEFYQFPRMVAHIDNSAIAYLRDIYHEFLNDGDRILDLMSSRYSHLPANFKAGFVHATGMNLAELAANPQLDDYVVHNLNKNPTLPFGDGEFDAVLCAVSVQYLEQPLEVFSDVRRVLKTDAPFLVSFSNRCFPTKAMRLWLQGSDAHHVKLVERYMHLTGFSNVEIREKRGGVFGIGGDPLYVVIGRG